MGLDDQSLVSKIISNMKIHNADNDVKTADKRRTLTDSLDLRKYLHANTFVALNTTFGANV
jgi:hypothetical protein